ncbi:MAG: hypothetical protein PHR14_08535 [Oscillospiraceae bacterium]|nr:hypothetical protein [Oscillospiraceae bacterium]
MSQNKVKITWKAIFAVALVMAAFVAMSTAVSAGFIEFILGDEYAVMATSSSYYQPGMPPLYNQDHNMVRQETGSAHSSFLSYVGSLGYSTSGWTYYMETWSDPNSSDPYNTYEIHYWSNGSTQFYHN